MTGGGEVTLAFLGEQMGRMQGDIRKLQTEVGFIKTKITHIEAEQIEMRQTIHLAVGELTTRMMRFEHRLGGLGERMGGIETRLEKLEQRHVSFEAFVDARFAQMAETMATNTQVLLTAIQGRPSN
jgi:chromosome segregation ATPase